MAGRQKPASSIFSITAAQGVIHIFATKSTKMTFKELRFFSDSASKKWPLRGSKFLSTRFDQILYA
jgi:hypothetical protein